MIFLFAIFYNPVQTGSIPQTQEYTLPSPLLLKEGKVYSCLRPETPATITNNNFYLPFICKSKEESGSAVEQPASNMIC